MVFNLHPGISVARYPYRAASVRDIFIEMSRSDPEVAAFEQLLNNEAGTYPDNHVVFELRGHAAFGYNGQLYLWCSDDTMYIGTKLVKGDW